MDKSVLYKLSYGLYAIGAQGGACIVNTVFQITSTPAVIALSMNKDNATHDLIKNQAHFSVSIFKPQQRAPGSPEEKSLSIFPKHRNISSRVPSRYPCTCFISQRNLLFRLLFP